MEKRENIRVDVLRGEQIESRHLVDAIVLDRSGLGLESYGDPSIGVFTRSVIKPIQALSFALSNATQLAPDPVRALALACASHDAQSLHIEAIDRWLRALDLDENCLVCGATFPATAVSIERGELRKRRVHHNCSGKHMGMITTCLQKNWDPQTYAEWNHPIQVEIRERLGAFATLDMHHAPWGVDGCGLPTYFLPLTSLAKAMGAFLTPADHGEAVASAMTKMREAWREEPWMISGHGSLDAEAIAATEGHVFIKVGAEGNYVAILFDQGLSIALKARDGAFRACEAALFALLKKHGGLCSAALDRIEKFARPPIRNAAGVAVGRVEVSGV